jgi:hypothetical protein
LFKFLLVLLVCIIKLFHKIVLNSISENRIPAKWLVIKIYCRQNCVCSNGNFEIYCIIHQNLNSWSLKWMEFTQFKFKLSTIEIDNYRELYKHEI